MRRPDQTGDRKVMDTIPIPTPGEKMPSFGTKSLKELGSCHQELIDVAKVAILHRDFSVIEGKRSEAQQQINVDKGVSQTMNSKHVYPLGMPSNAMDLYPWPFPGWPDEDGISEKEKLDRIKQFVTLAAYILGVGNGLGIELISGLDWDGDWQFNDQNFNDYPHIQRNV